MKPKAVWPQSQVFHPVPVVLNEGELASFARGHLAVSGDIFNDQNWARTTDIYWVETRDSAKYPTVVNPVQQRTVWLELSIIPRLVVFFFLPQEFKLRKY